MPTGDIFGGQFANSFGGAAIGALSSTIGGIAGSYLGFGGGAVGALVGSLFGKGGGGSPGQPASSPGDNPMDAAASQLSAAASQLSQAAMQLSASVRPAGPPNPNPMQGPLLGQVGNSAVNPSTGLPFLNNGVTQAPVSIAPVAGGAGAGAGAAAAAGPIGIAVAAAMMIKDVTDKAFERFHAMVDVVPRVTEGFLGMVGMPASISKAFGSVAGLVVAPAHMIGEALHGLASPIELVKDPLKMWKAGLSAGVDAVSAFGRAIYDMRDPGAMLAQAVAPFVAQVNKFNPGAVDRMNLAFDNLSAAAGRAFQPVIYAAELFANELNEAYTAIAAPVQEFVADLAGLSVGVGRELFASLFSIIQAGIPVVRGLIADLSPMAPTARAVLQGFTELAVGAVRVGGSIISGVMGFVGPAVAGMRPFIGIVMEGGRILRSLWDAASSFGSAMISVVTPFLGLGTWASVLRVAFDATVSGLQQFTAALSASASMMARIAQNPQSLLTSANRAWLAEWFGTDFRQALARMQTAGTTPAAMPGGQGMTFAAQQARHIGIEDVGLEARRAAFSQGTDIQQIIATNTGNIANAITAMQTWLQSVLPGFLSPPAAPDMG